PFPHSSRSSPSLPCAPWRAPGRLRWLAQPQTSRTPFANRVESRSLLRRAPDLRNWRAPELARAWRDPRAAQRGDDRVVVSHGRGFVPLLGGGAHLLATDPRLRRLAHPHRSSARYRLSCARAGCAGGRALFSQAAHRRLWVFRRHRADAGQGVSHGHRFSNADEPALHADLRVDGVRLRLEPAALLQAAGGWILCGGRFPEVQFGLADGCIALSTAAPPLCRTSA